MESLLNLTLTAAQSTALSLLHNWPYLLLSVVVAAALRNRIDADRIASFLRRHKGTGVLAATAAAVGTPLCSCGTTAVVLGMMAGSMPWAPIVAFMVSSPLTSPEGLLYTAGLFGWPFAAAFFIASIALGLAGGIAAGIVEARGWLGNQTRIRPPQALRPAPAAAVSCAVCQPQIQPVRVEPLAASACSCGAAGSLPSVPIYESQNIVQANMAKAPALPWAGIRQYLDDSLSIGKQLLIMFVGFAFIGFFLNGLIPTAWVAAAFGGGNFYSVPLAATLGLPLYINAEASLPLVRALIDSGMSQGVALAFLIAGAGTSFGAISGALTIARWRVIALVVGTLWIGAMLSGYAFNLLLALKVF